MSNLLLMVDNARDSLRAFCTIAAVLALKTDECAVILPGF